MKSKGIEVASAFLVSIKKKKDTINNEPYECGTLTIDGSDGTNKMTLVTKGWWSWGSSFTNQRCTKAYIETDDSRTLVLEFTGTKARRVEAGDKLVALVAGMKSRGIEVASVFRVKCGTLTIDGTNKMTLVTEGCSSFTNKTCTKAYIDTDDNETLVLEFGIGIGTRRVDAGKQKNALVACMKSKGIEVERLNKVEDNIFRGRRIGFVPLEPSNCRRRVLEQLYRRCLEEVELH